MNALHVSELDKLLLSVSPKAVLRLFAVYFLPVLAFFAVGNFFVHRLEHQQQLTVRLAKEEQRIHLAENLLVHDLETLASDLFLLAHSPELSEVINDVAGGKKGGSALERRFLSFARDRRLYDQIRYIDETGRESVRINFNGQKAQAVSPIALQDKSRRYYFVETRDLAADSLFVSPLDLNIEHGEVERPFKPVVRVATPLHDSQGGKRGILVINYLAERMLNRMWAPLPKTRDAVYQLVNADGYWLRHPDESHEWGFVFGRDQRFGTRFPEAWQRIDGDVSGQFVNHDGAFTYSRVNPRREMSRVNGSPLVADSVSAPEWILIGHIPAHQLTFRLTEHVTVWIVLGFLLAVFLAALATWRLARANAIKRQWESLTNLLFLAVDQSPAAIIVTDRKGDIEYVNDRFCVVSGFSIDKVMGKNPRVLKSGEKSADEYKELWNTITQGRTWRGEFHNKRNDGSYYWAEAQISPITDNSGHITHFIGIQEDVTEKRELQKKLKQMAETDPLTGSFNRRYFLEQIEAEITRCRRHGRAFSLLLLDIDRFKSINDQWGHPVGDQVLSHIVKLLQASIRGHDVLARFGGEEFVILLPETDIVQAEAFAERICSTIEASAMQAGDKTVLVTASIGCSQWNSDEAGFDDLLTRSDAALYRAKKQGRNRVCAG